MTQTDTHTNADLSTNQNDPVAEAIHPAPETEMVTTWKVACAGNDELGMGHPRVWMVISPDTGFVDCGYCDKRFIIDREHAHDDH